MGKFSLDCGILFFFENPSILLFKNSFLLHLKNILKFYYFKVFFFQWLHYACVMLALFLFSFISIIFSLNLYYLLFHFNFISLFLFSFSLFLDVFSFGMLICVQLVVLFFWKNFAFLNFLYQVLLAFIWLSLTVWPCSLTVMPLIFLNLAFLFCVHILYKHCPSN